MYKEKEEALISGQDVGGSIENGKDTAAINDSFNRPDGETTKDQ